MVLARTGDVAEGEVRVTWLDSIREAWIAVNPDGGHIEEWDTHAARLLGMRPEHRGKPLAQVFPALGEHLHEARVVHQGVVWRLFRTTDPSTGRLLFLFHEDVPADPHQLIQLLRPLQRRMADISPLTLEAWWAALAAWAQDLPVHDVQMLWVGSEDRTWDYTQPDVPASLATAFTEHVAHSPCVLHSFAVEASVGVVCPRRQHTNLCLAALIPHPHATPAVLAAWREVAEWVHMTYEAAASTTSILRLNTLLTDLQAIVGTVRHAPLETVWNHLAQRICHAFDADAAYLLRWDVQRDIPVPVAAVGPLAQRYAMLSAKPHRRTLTASVLSANRVIAVEDVFNSPFIDLEVALLFPQRSLLGLPLVHEGQRIGAILLAWDEPRTFSPATVQEADVVRHALSFFLHRALMEQEVHRRVSELETVHQAHGTIATTLDMDEAVCQILEQVQQMVPAHVCMLLLEDETAQNGRTVRLHAALGTDAPLAGQQYPVDAFPPLQTILQDGVPVTHTTREGVGQQEGLPWKEAHTWLGVPLILQGYARGVLAVYRRDAFTFSSSHVRMLTTFARQAATVLENARLYSALRRRAQMLERLYRAAEDLVSKRSPHDILQRLAHHLIATAQCVSCHIGIIEGASLHLIAEVTREDFQPRASLLGRTFPLKELPLLHETITTFSIRTVSKESPELLPRERRAFQRFGVEHALLVPVWGQEQPLGIAVLHFNAPPDHLDEDAVSLLRSLANYTGVVLTNVRYYEQEQRRARQMEALYRATASLLGTLDMDELLDEILGAAMRAIPSAEKGTLALADETGQLRVRAVRGYDDPHVRNMVMPETGYAAKSAREALSLLIEDVDALEDVFYEGDVAEVQAVKSGIVVPLVYGDRVYGVISLDATKKFAFTRDDLEILRTFAITATAAIHNALLYADVQQMALTDDLTQVWNRRGFFDIARREFYRARRYSRPLSALMVDLDYFKRINDTYGHFVGDQVLARFAHVIVHHVRDVDIVGRYGGEEFMVLMPEATLEQAVQVAERLRETIARTRLETDVGAIQVTASLGVAALRDEDTAFQDILRRADQALYKAKEAGRNRVAWEA